MCELKLVRWLIDLSVLPLLEEKKLKKADFIVTENYHLRIKSATARMLIEGISANFNRTARYKGKNHTYQNILLNNVQHLANFILGKQKPLAFSIPALSIVRTDTLEIQDRIRKMSPAERKRLGINKSTLWYQLNQLNKDKHIRICGKTLEKLA